MHHNIMQNYINIVSTYLEKLKYIFINIHDNFKTFLNSIYLYMIFMYIFIHGLS